MQISPKFAFDVCQDFYVIARGAISSRLPTSAGRMVPAALQYRPAFRPRYEDFVADCDSAAERALVKMPSRLILYRVYYAGGAEWRSARKFCGISENTFAQWTEQIQIAVGAELLRRRIFPPGKYMRETAV